MEKGSQVFPHEKITEFPVVYKHYIYYCLNEDNRWVRGEKRREGKSGHLLILFSQKFVKTPVQYVSQPAPPLFDAHVHPQVLILGPPRSGKSSISKKLAQKLGAVRLSLGKVVKMVAATNTSLGVQVL